MTRSEIEALTERFKNGWRERNVDELLTARADECVVESPLHGTVVGREAIADIWRKWFTAFPDVQFDITDLLVDGDRALVFWVVRGTHTAEFAGVAPTGRRFSVRGTSLYTLENDLIVHERRLYDTTALMLLVGALKAKPM